jgi:hypothetical protein
MASRPNYILLMYMVFLLSKAVNNTVMRVKIRAMSWLQNMQVLTLLTLLWRLFSGYCMEHFALIFASKGCQYRINGCLQPVGTWLTQDAKLKIFDPLLTLMLRMGRSPCCTLLRMEAANMSVMHKNDQVTCELLYLQDHTSLTLRWHSC